VKLTTEVLGFFIKKIIFRLLSPRGLRSSRGFFLYTFRLLFTVDTHCAGKEQAIRYACILLDIADGKKLDFDELILEKRGTTIWVHFAVRPKGNRRYVHF
jgi:hypothetical protein